MAVQCFSSLSFDTTINKFEKKTKGACSNVLSDIVKAISASPELEEFLKISDVLNRVEDGQKKILVKTRIANSSMREGKKGGFRLISFIDFDRNAIDFLEVYPKKGKFAKSDLTEDEYVDLLKEYLSQLKDGTLSERNPSENLTII